MRVPSAGQFERLLSAGRGSVVLAPRRAEWMPLLRNGWVERVEGVSPRGGVLPPLRVTAEGFRALARGLERHGWPS